MITYTLIRQDASGENTSTTFSTAYTFNSTPNADVARAAEELTLALNSLCSVPSYRVTFTVPHLTQAPTRGGHRELKWVLRFRDSENRIYTHEVGTANPSLPRIYAGGRALLDPSWTGYTQMKNRLEEHVTNRFGHALTLIEVEEVGRNL